MFDSWKPLASLCNRFFFFCNSSFFPKFLQSFVTLWLFFSVPTPREPGFSFHGSWPQDSHYLEKSYDGWRSICPWSFGHTQLNVGQTPTIRPTRAWWHDFYAARPKFQAHSEQQFDELGAQCSTTQSECWKGVVWKGGSLHKHTGNNRNHEMTLLKLPFFPKSLHLTSKTVKSCNCNRSKFLKMPERNYLLQLHSAQRTKKL